MSIFSRRTLFASALVWLAFLHMAAASAADVPDWLRAQTSVTLPAYDEKTDAVVLYDDTTITVMPDGKIRSLQRRALRILRPGGERWGIVRMHFDDRSRILHLRAWGLPANDKPFVVKEKDALETSLYGVENGELASDLRTKILSIPAALPGNVIAYEAEQESTPYLLPPIQWYFQDELPVRLARYTLQLPRGWSYRASWLNYAAIEPVASGSDQWQWSVNDLPAIRLERAMPPWQKIAGRLSLSLVKPGETASQTLAWTDVGKWYTELTRGRLDATPALKQKAVELGANKNNMLEKIAALASFVQKDIRYVAIELGIGGFQPHPAGEVLQHRYGDCKDKVTLLASLLHEIGIDSYYVIINTERGAVDADTAPNIGFNHVILAIALPDSLNDPSLLAVTKRPNVGRLLFFDPTDTFTPLGRIRGELQANYGLLVTGNGGELLSLPQLPAATAYTQLTARLKLTADGDISGDVEDVRMGDSATRARFRLRLASQETDRIRPVEVLLADSLSNYRLVHAAVANVAVLDQPFEWHYTFEAPRYAKRNGDLLILRPWVIRSLSNSLLEKRDPRQHPIEFDGPEQYRDTFEFALPDGYEVESMPEAINIDAGFAVYQRKIDMAGRSLRYTRSLEIKQLSVPVAKAEEFKQFYRKIYADERSVLVLSKPAR